MQDDLASVFDELTSEAALQVSESASSSQYRSSESVQDSASELLTRYKQQRDCVLAGAGWLDLTGNVWGCLINGGTWVDLCMVSRVSTSPDTQSDVLIVRLWKDQWEQNLVNTTK